MIQQSTSGIQKKYLHILVHSSTIHSNQEMGANQMSTDRRGIYIQWNIIQPLPPTPYNHLTAIILLSVSINLTTLDTFYKKNRIVFL